VIFPICSISALVVDDDPLGFEALIDAPMGIVAPRRLSERSLQAEVT